MKRSLFILFFFVATSVFGSHIVGGEFELLHLEGYRYRLNLILYFDLNNGNPGARDPEAQVRIFRKSDNMPIMDVVLPFITATEVSYFQPECSNGEIRTDKLYYTSQIELSPELFDDPGGYYVSWERCCRNYDITNIYSDVPGSGTSAGQTFYLEFPPVVMNGQQFINSSPQLFPPLNDYACPNRPYWVDFAGIDVDGDSLVYSLVTPRNTHTIQAIPDGGPQPGPYPAVKWRPGFAADDIMNGAPDLAISSKGFLTVTPTKAGLFVFAVSCKEYRNGQKIGEVIRDFQMLVLGSCPVADPPLIEGKTLADTAYTYVDYMNVTFPNGITDAERCINVQVSDPDALKIEDNLTERIWLHVVPIGFDTEEDVKAILPAVSNATLVNGSVESFDICFPECPLLDGPYTLGVIAFDDACALPLSDTLRVNVNIEPPPNSRAYFITSDASATLVEGNDFHLPIYGRDDDGDSVIVSILTDGFELADAGMSFDTTMNANGEYSTVFNWQTGCDVYDFTSRTEFRVRLLLDDLDQCDLGIPDTLDLDMKVILPPNTDPVLTSDLPQTSFLNPIDKPLQFNLFGLDTDGDDLELIAVGDGFDLEDYTIEFPKVSGNSQLQASFNWMPTCQNMVLEKSDDDEYDSKLLTIFFILNDLDKCKFPNYDTLEVNVTVTKPLNTPPTISVQNNNERIAFQANTITTLIVGDLVDVDVTASDLEMKHLSLFLADSSDVPNGLSFERKEGEATVKSKLSWLVSCDNLGEGFKPRTFSLVLGAADDICYNDLDNTRVLNFVVQDKANKEEAFLPSNVFTPNGDGHNDTFSLPDLPIDNCAGQFRGFRVHNRWGVEVYATIDRAFVWDGDGLEAGVYYYKVEFSNKEYSGTLSILY